MIESAYRELFSDTVLLAAPSATDAYGKRTWASASTVPARVEIDDRLMRTSRAVVATRGRVFLYGAYTDVTNDYLLVHGSASPIILGVEHVHDENGPHHTVLRFGNTQR